MASVIVVGAGSRGLGVYAAYVAEHGEQFQIKAVAEPRAYFREELARQHGLEPSACFEDWRELLQQPQLADAAIVATQDRDHLEPALALMERGYDLLLEKPMAVSLGQCQTLQRASRKFQRLLVVAHVLRYTPYFRKLKEVAASGWLGQLATVRHFEPVNYWHQAHSFVRGNWRNSQQSAPMILAKSCHDLDLLCHLVGEEPLAVSSFGRLSHFRPENRPPEATDRCLDCPLAERECAYSALRFYADLARQGQTGWPLDVLTPDTSEAGVLKALREGPYGRCVYSCDNDVVDHQVVALEFASGVSATFTMTAFTDQRLRETELLGSLGQLTGDGQVLRLRSFRPWLGPAPQGAVRDAGGDWVWDFRDVPTEGHQGGDRGLMDFFAWCLNHRQQALALPLAEEALRGHALCFAAEQARLERRVVELGPLLGQHRD